MRTHKRTAAIATSVIGLSLLGVSGAQSAPARPDLVVTAVDWAPTGLVAGQATTFRATITNKGSAPTPGGVIHGVAFSVGGQLKTWSDTWTYSLRPGESITVVANSGPTKSATWAATTGTPTVTAFVDDAKRITEGDEANNTLTRTVPVATGLTTRLRVTDTGVATVATVGPNSAPTGLSSNIKGSVYIGCVDENNVPVSGTEKYLNEGTIGNETYPWGGPFSGSGQGEAPASKTPTQVIGRDMETGEILRGNQHGTDGLVCAPGTAPAFTRFQAKTMTTTRWTKPATGPSTQIASVTVPVDLDIRL